jgi:PAS domain S-box-containing protein
MNEQLTKVKKHLIRLENLNLPKTFTAILDLLDDCIFIVDKNGYFVFYNKANEKLDKLKRGFVIGRHLTECFKLNERTSITLNVLSEQMPILDTFQDYTAASGHRIISVSSSYPLFNNKELIGALTITKDITRFKKLMYIIDKEPAEELLANWTILLDDCIFIVDKNGYFVFYNKANEKLDKLKRGFVIGRHLTECFKLNERTSITLNVLSEQMPFV